MPTKQRRRRALDHMVQNSVTTMDPSLTTINVSNLGMMVTEAPLQMPEDLTANARFQNSLLDLVHNEYLSRGAMIQRWMDPRRDYNKECGYPETYEITSEKWQQYYERHPIAARVVELMPSECWQVVPDIVEDEDPNTKTPFEQAVEDLALSLRGQSSHFRPDEKESHPLWEACRRADILSRIGRFGVILLGFNDGLSMNQPVEGWEEPEHGPMIWNQSAIPFLHRHVSEYIDVDAQGNLVWNAPPEDEEEDEDEEETQAVEGNGKKKQKKRIRGLPPEPLEKPKTKGQQPNLAAFGNVGAQQSKYRDPQDVDGQNNIQPYDDSTARPNRITPEEEASGSRPEEEAKTSIQPFQEEEGDEEPLSQEQEVQQKELLYIRAFPENLVSIIQYDQNMNSPRYGLPIMYRVTLNDPQAQPTGVNMPMSTVEVHYSRIIHVADVGTTSSEIYGHPAMQPVLNNLIDLQKIYGAVGEGYWKNAFATLAAETHPQLGGDVEIDTSGLKTQMKKWRDSLDRVLAATGITWKTIAPQVVDPNSHVENQLRAICIKLGCPIRVFMGSEQGVLASDQDSRAWNERVKERRKNYLTPRVIVPIIDRLIQVGVLPAPQQGYSISWDSEQKLTPQEQAQVAGALTGALATYISGQGDQFIEPIAYLTEIWGWDRERAQSVVDATLAHIQQQQEQEAVMGQQMMDPISGQPMEQDPETGEYIDPSTGEPVQQDEFGRPVMQDPETGEPIPAQQMSPSESQGPLGAEAAMAEEGGIPPEEQIPGEDQIEPPQGEVDEEGLPIDPQTGFSIVKENGRTYLVDRESGNVYDAESQRAIGNLFEDEGEGDQEIPEEGEGVGADQIGEEEEAGYEDGDEVAPDEDMMQELTQDPETGRLVDAEGFQLDEETGIIYSPEGEAVGNIDDLEDEEDEDDPE